MSDQKFDAVDSSSFAQSFEKALATLKRTTGTLIRTGAMASALALGPGAIFVACATNDAGDQVDLPDLLNPAGSADWYNDEGQRDTLMVGYLGSSWQESYDCNTRGGCMGLAMFLKVQVQPVASANLDDKRVGVQYAIGADGETRTAMGNYFTTLENGNEEWHVRIDVRSWEITGPVRFAAW
jgi:hypothetical protein